MTYTPVIEQSGGWWIGWIKEVPGVNAQELTREGVVMALEECLRDVSVLSPEEPTAS
jgi:predicted RNase H-like HicB family nuclease